MNKSLYNIYRPKNFNDIIGQDFIKTILKNSIVNNSLSNAYIFCGKYGIGKTSIAKIFAKAINCVKHDGDACNSCNNCLMCNSSECSDIIELDAASNNGVDEIRNIIDSTKFLPTYLNKKIYILDEVHMLTNSSWNALLKTIEEPSDHVLFIFVTTNQYKIPETIISRCETYNFHSLDNDQIEELLRKTVAKENITINQAALKQIVRLSKSSARDALNILGQLTSYSNNKINLDVVNDVFRNLTVKNKVELINLIFTNEAKFRLKMNEYDRKIINYYELTKDIMNLLIDFILYKNTNSTDVLLFLSKDDITDLKINFDQANKLLHSLEEYLYKIKSSDDPRLYFEYAALFLSNNDYERNNSDSNKPNLKVGKAQNQKSEANLEYINNSKGIPIEEIVTLRDEKKLDKTINLSDLNYKQINVNPNKQKEIDKITGENPLPYKLNKFNQEKYLNANDINSIDNKQLFFQIASNNKKDNKNILNECLLNIKSDFNIDPLIRNLFVNSNKILMASNNGFVLLFDDEIEADLFNSIIQKNELSILKFINEYFKNLYKIVAVDKNTVKLWKNEFIDSINNKIYYADVDISMLKSILDKNDQTPKKIAEEIFKK